MAPSLALALLPLLAGAGEGVHVFDASWERVFVGAPPFASSLAVAAPLERGEVAARGRWLDEGGVLRMVEPPPAGDGTYVTSVTVEDGLVRARFVAGERLDVSLLVRASADASGELDSGYAISIEPARGAVPATLRALRYEHRLARALGAEAKIVGAPLAKGTVVELVVLLAGPFIDATLLDGQTLEPRARVVVRDRGFARGRVGVRMARARDAAGNVAMLSLGAGPQAAPLAGAGGGDDEGAGPERLLVIPTAHEALLPRDLVKLVVERTEAAGPSSTGGAEGATSLLVTSPTGLERARRAGVTVLQASARVPWKYVDASMRKVLGRKTPASTAAGLRIDEGYKDAVVVEQILRAYAAKFPHIAKLEEIGRSLEGRPILALKISRNPNDDEDEPAVLLDGAHHGGELMSTELALDAIQQLLERYRKDPALTRVVDGMAVWVVPLVNPDCLHRFAHFSRDADRKNARDIDGDGVAGPDEGVDLYRNYPVRFGELGEVGSRSWPWSSRYRGPAAASEPEVQALMALAERERFVASIDFHTNATMILVPYTDPGMDNPALNEAWTVAEEIAAPLPVQPNGKRYTVVRNLYPVDGTAQDWFRFAHGTVALLVEAPTHNPQPYAKTRTLHVQGTRPTWQLLCARVLTGPGVAGRVRDADGNAVPAEVIIEEMRPRMGEVWTARPRDGRFHRLFPDVGTYTVRFRAAGFVEQTRKVTLDERTMARVDVTLHRSPP